VFHKENKKCRSTNSKVFSSEKHIKKRVPRKGSQLMLRDDGDASLKMQKGSGIIFITQNGRKKKTEGKRKRGNNAIHGPNESPRWRGNPS